MPDISQGNNATLVLAAGDAIRISTLGTATVRGVYGAPATTTTLTANWQDFGPYGVPARLELVAVAGSASYLQKMLTPVTYDTATGQVFPSGVSGAGNITASAPYGVLDMQQVSGITRAVRGAGKMAANFATGAWLKTSGTATFTAGVTGFDAAGNVTGIRSRTGQPEMATLAPVDNTLSRITIQTPATYLLQSAWAGKFGLWLHVAVQPGYEAGGTLAGTIDIEITTDGGKSYSNALLVSYNSNQIREGWNFLKFVQRDPLAYQSSSPTTEYHPLGIVSACYGTGAAANILANAVTELRISVSNFGGATLTFDSIWTGFDTLAQIVLGCDSAGSSLLQYGAPVLTQYGWKGYTAIPGRVWVSGSTLISDWTAPAANARTLYDTYGWDNINHSANHLANGTLTAAAAIDYEVAAVQAMYSNAGMVRGGEFYASPQSSTSRLSETVIKNRGFKAQRHGRKWNVCVTPWGVDNPQHLGAIDIGSASAGGISSVTGTAAGSVAGWQTFTKLQRFVDTLIAYGDTGFPFWHDITTLGDTGSGNDLTGDNLLITKSAFEKFLAYIKTKEDAGLLRVRDGITGFYYGVGR